MSITATEFKHNLGKYLILAETEDIYITRNGKVAAKLSNPFQDRVDMAKSLFGIQNHPLKLPTLFSNHKNDLLQLISYRRSFF